MGRWGRGHVTPPPAPSFVADFARQAARKRRGEGAGHPQPGTERQVWSVESVGGKHEQETPVAARVRVAARLVILVVSTLGPVGVLARVLGLPLLTSTLGPTVYLFAVHSKEETSRWRNAAVGHGVAVLAGLAALAAFGLWSSPPASSAVAPPPPRIGALLLAVALTVSLLEFAHSHHAPAAASALLVASGLARPGVPLEGLVVGLAVAVCLGPVLSRLLPLARDAAQRGL